MDRNSAIGLTLIAVLLLVYFNWFAPQPPVETGAPVTQSLTPTDTTTAKADTTSTVLTEVAIAPVEEQLTQVENNELILTFTSRGGILKEVELKKFKTYFKKPLVLVSPRSNAFNLIATVDGKEIDLYALPYSLETKTLGDTTTLTFSAAVGSHVIRNIYRVPGNGYAFGYELNASGLSGEHLAFRWTDFIPPQEKSIEESRTKTTINYYSAANGFDGLTEATTDPESETLTEPVKWVGIAQKFFTSAIIAKSEFAGGELDLRTNIADSTVVKTAKVMLRVPVKDVVGGNSRFTYFFGPNDYKVITQVTEGFERNLYLGWPPVLWVNKFVIVPIFHFLEQYISNYGIIIMILVIIIKLILTPLSYTSYLGMAKMRLLKPELDLIKEKNGDNMAQTQQDQMKLYSQAGVNPFAGCIPLLLQMPILFAMFYFFPVSVELRQKAFLWADDLSTYDSVANLPFTIPFYGSHVSLFVLLMTASTLIYQWQNNQLSSVQGPMKSLSYIMPVVFMFVLNTFSAGLSFYYFVSNLVTFAQQAIIKRFVDEDKIMAVMEDHKKKMMSGGTPGKSGFMAKLNEAMKASEANRKASEDARRKKK